MIRGKVVPVVELFVDIGNPWHRFVRAALYLKLNWGFAMYSSAFHADSSLAKAGVQGNARVARNAVQSQLPDLFGVENV
jgi:hypothetical protein